MKKSQIIAAAAGITVILAAAGGILGYRAGYSDSAEKANLAEASEQNSETITENDSKTESGSESTEAPDDTSSTGGFETATALTAPDTGTYSLSGKENIPTVILCHVTESTEDSFKFYVAQAQYTTDGSLSDEEILIPESEAHAGSEGVYEYSDGDLNLFFQYYGGRFTAVGKSLQIFGMGSLYNMDNYYNSAELNGIPGNIFNMEIPKDIIAPAENVPEDTGTAPEELETTSGPVSPVNGAYFASHLSGENLLVVIHVEDADESSFRFRIGQITDSADGGSEETIIFPERTAYYTENGYYEYVSEGYHLYFKYNPACGEERDRMEMYGLESLYDPYQYVLPMQYKEMSGNLFSESEYAL